MALRCKPGDLAILVRPPEGWEWNQCDHEDFGKIVKVLEFSPIGSTILQAPAWLVVSEGSPIQVMGYPGEVHKRSNTAIIPDCCLRPIRGDETGLTEEMIEQAVRELVREGL